MTGRETYDFGAKRNWRRQVWSEIAARVSERRNAFCLSLESEGGSDRKIAAQHGFCPDNIVTVEVDIQRADNFRENGKTVIVGDMVDVLRGWPLDGPKVSILYADLCCGFEPDVGVILESMESHERFLDCVALINLQRGRDSRTNPVRQALAGLNVYAFDKEGKEVPSISQKHRGMQLLFEDALVTRNVAIRGETSVYGREVDGAPFGKRATMSIRYPEDWKDHTEDLILLNRLMLRWSPKYFSYRSSGGLIMDSIVISSPFSLNAPVHKAFKFMARAEARAYGLMRRKSSPQDIRRQIAAALAVRTMRMNGKLPHSPA